MNRLQRHGAYMQKHHPAEALSLFQRLASQFPGVGEIHYRLGKLYFDAGNMVKAKENYLLASKLNADLVEAFFNLGLLYASQGEYEQAEKMFARAVVLKPTYLDEALFNLAYTQKEQGLTKEAISSLNLALEVNSHNKVAAKMLKQLTNK
jgi:tetratricopeptide (TPR) repeat protein